MNRDFAKQTAHQNLHPNRHLLHSLWVSAILLTLALLAALPGRMGQRLFARSLGYSSGEYLFLGICADAAYLLMAWIVLMVAFHCVLYRARGVMKWGVGAAFMVAQSAMTFTLIAANEFYIQRGMHPTWFDIRQGFNADFLSAEVTTLGLSRYFYTWIGSLLSSAALIGLSLGSLVAFSRRPFLRSWISLTALSALFCAVLLQMFYLLSPVLSSIDSASVVRSPLRYITKSIGQNSLHLTLGISSLVTRYNPEKAEIEKGAAMLGFGPLVKKPIPLSIDTNSLGERVVEQSQALQKGVARLSQKLFASHTQRPLFIWHIVVESLGAEDIKAMEPQADERVAPFLNSLYRQAASPSPSVIAAHRLYQAGVRTSYALGANLCGWGTMPYLISVAREFSNAPLRCLPDLFVDAGLQAHAIYGADISFDNMGLFLRKHGIQSIVSAHNIERNAAQGAWGVSDRVMLMRALKEPLSSDPTLAHSHYTFVLTLSGHHPYARPQDTSPEVESRVSQLTQSLGFDEDTRRRLLTVAYTDDVLKNFVDALKKSEFAQKGDIVVMISGDHTSGSLTPWNSKNLSEPELHQKLAHIPMALLLPSWFRPTSASNDTQNTASDAAAITLGIHQNLKNLALSQNDLPHLLLALVGSAAPLNHIPLETRWHNMSAQIWLSKESLRACLVYTPVVFGVDTWGVLVGIDEHGEVVWLERQIALTESKGNQPTQSLLKPLYGFWSHWLRSKQEAVTR